jgi:hypothetical protein
MDGYTRRPHGRMKTCLHRCSRESTKTSLLPSLGYDHPSIPSAARRPRQDPLMPTDTWGRPTPLALLAIGRTRGCGAGKVGPGYEPRLNSLLGAVDRGPHVDIKVHKIFKLAAPQRTLFFSGQRGELQLACGGLVGASIAPCFSSSTRAYVGAWFHLADERPRIPLFFFFRIASSTTRTYGAIHWVMLFCG